MPLAHAGNWVVDTIFVAPVLIVVLWVSIKTLIERRREAAEDSAPREGPS